MDAEATVESPSEIEAKLWLRAIRDLDMRSCMSPQQERDAAAAYAEEHALIEDRSLGTINNIVNLFRARVLLRKSRGRPLDDIEQEYHLQSMRLFRLSGYNRNVRLSIDELTSEELPVVVKIAKRLLELGEKATH